jgi:exodeoxyribonuclease V alpha subunit
MSAGASVHGQSRETDGMVGVMLPAQVACLAPFVDAGVFGAPEVHLAAWVARAAQLHPVDDELLILGVAVASWAAEHGHACADLARLGPAVERERPIPAHVDASDAPTWPPAENWLRALRSGASCGIVRVVERAEPAPPLDSAPLVLCGSRLYLQRHWVDECTVAASLLARVRDGIGLQPEAFSTRAAKLLDRLLPPTETDGTANQQRVAADLVFGRNLALVVGGPGTGKTYSVARLLMAMLTDTEDRGTPSLRIALAAPTGKAATRLAETIRIAIARVEGDEDELGIATGDRLSASVKHALLALEPTTIHRLLGPLPDRRQRFTHGASSPLPFDVVLVDETSMVSTPLLARLVEATSASARLVLIGDPDQLESVELGAALGDIATAATRPTSPLTGHAVRLQRGHRFGHDSPIARLADCVREERVADAVALLRGKNSPGLTLEETDHPTSERPVAAVHNAIASVLESVRAAAEVGDARTALASLASVRVLCAHRLGEYGVERWNEWCERWVCGPKGAPSAWYPGRPLLVTRNDFRLGLANGDTGVVVLVDGRPQAAFADSTDPSGCRLVDPVDLEEIETAYAMTIHKSQGSEYDTVVLVLPPSYSPLVGRELVYTGITRARQHLLIVGSEESFRRCVGTPARRMTGLAEALA